MNETPATGGEWPGAKERRRRLAEAIELIRAALERGARRLRRRVLQDRRSATIYDRPDEPVPIYVAASGPLAAKLAGRVGDGFICTSGKDPELYRELLGNVAEGAEKAGRDPTRRSASMIEIKVSYDRDAQYALRRLRAGGPRSR